jgi:ATP-dependent helicase HrpA
VPLALLPQLDPAVMAWTIPGWHEAKLRALLDALPKAVRKTLGPLDELAATLALAVRPFDGAMLPALERAVHEHTGERVPRTAWDQRAVPVHLGFTFRIVDEHDRELGLDRDLGELQRKLGPRAREVWARAPRESHERAGLTAWDFETLPVSVELDIGGRRLLAYPALVETETAVDLRLLESPEVAADATRVGLRRLFLIQLRTTVAKLETQVPGVIANSPLAVPGAPSSPRRQIVLRALDTAFGLATPDTFPRTKAAFAERLVEGRIQLPQVLAALGETAVELAAELDKVRAALKPLAGKPGLLRAAYDDIQSQLAHLAPPDLMRVTPPGRFAHLVRYARAIQVRLQRLLNDPPKDQQKAAQITPFWQRYLTQRDELRAQGRPLTGIDEVGWLIEELRVQTFAPELKTAVPISAKRLQDVWTTIVR